MKPTAVQNLNTAKLSKLRTDLSRCNGKICAYIRVGKITEARTWAITLTEALKEHGLIP